MKKITDFDYAPRYVKFFEANPFRWFGYTVCPAPPDYRGVLYEVWESNLSYEHNQENLFNRVIYYEEEKADSEEFCQILSQVCCEAAKRGRNLFVHEDRIGNLIRQKSIQWFEEYERNSTP